ncbi:MAG: trypsin-like peptidase domain-containing protein, partial [Myxococcota bacterium]|nr:trypsin-like peptidase domain-containing protein [Myxococcota bacterium]
MRYSVRIVAVCLALADSAVASRSIAQTTAQSHPSPAATPATMPTPAQVQASTVEAKRLSDGFVAVAERASPSVVQIDVTARDERADVMSRFFGRPSGDEAIARGMGSGVVFSPDGAILTNNHVVEEALTINVRLRDGRYLPARLVGRDPATDLAVVKIETTGLTPAKFADSDAARVGEWVVAIGSPFGLGYTVTAGVLSAKGRGGLGMNDIEDYLQTDASINPGNSGGPLCNLQGDVLGVNTMIAGRGQGIGFAVPSNMAQRVATQILKIGRVSRAWLGLSVQDLTPEISQAMHLAPGGGALINNVASDGPAYRANVRAGDVIASVGAHP